jgi:hypothetical protein
MGTNEGVEQTKKQLVGLRGMGRKSNVAMVAIGGLAAVQQFKIAVVAIIIIGLVSIISQALLDAFGKDVE